MSTHWGFYHHGQLLKNKQFYSLASPNASMKPGHASHVRAAPRLTHWNTNEDLLVVRETRKLKQFMMGYTQQSGAIFKCSVKSSFMNAKCSICVMIPASISNLVHGGT